MVLNKASNFKRSDIIFEKGVNFKFHSKFSNGLNFQIPKFYEVWAEIFDKTEIRSLSKITKEKCIELKNCTNAKYRPFYQPFCN